MAPQTPNQVNDKKVAEKTGQVDRAYVQLETMTTPTREDALNYPRQNSFFITITECTPNSGGGSRTKSISIGEKRRDRTCVVIRSMNNSMLADGTLQKALFAAYEKLRICNNGQTRANQEHTWNNYHLLQQPENFDVESLRLDVAVALDWVTYYEHIFGKGKNHHKEQYRSAATQGGSELSSSAVAPPHPQAFLQAVMAQSYPAPPFFLLPST